MKLLLPFLMLLFVQQATAQHSVPHTSGFSIILMGHKSATFDIAEIKKYPQAALGDVPIKNHKGEAKNIAKGVKGALLKSFFDKAPIATEKPKELSELYITLVASDGYRNVYSWNEIFNTEVGNHLYVITEIEGKDMEQMDGAILVMSLSDINTGGRYLRGLEKIEVRKVE